MQFRSVRAKFTLWYIGSFSILLLLSFGVTEFLFHQFALQAIDEALTDGAEKLERAMVHCVPFERSDREAVNECLDLQVRKLFPLDIVYVQLSEFPVEEIKTPTILAQSYTLMNDPLHFSPEAFGAAQKNGIVFEKSRRGHGEAAIRFLTRKIVLQQSQEYVLQFGIRTGEKQASESMLRTYLTTRPHIFFSIFPGFLLLAVVWGYFFMKRVFAPVHNIVTLARNITAEDLSHRIESIDSKDEIGELADTLNEMIARLDSSFQQIRQFSGDVAHELKTPLTALKGELEVALRKERSPEEYREILTSLLEDTNNLGKIIEDLLFLARMDANSIPLSFTELSLDEVVLEVYESTLRMAQDKQITLALTSIDAAEITGDAGLITRLLTNLMVNAIHYTPEGGKIELTVEASEKTICLTLQDTGIGIPEEALPHIFDRFYRVDQSRSHETGGSGLGLAIVQKIAEIHDARIEVESQVGRGTTFKVNWKR